MKHLLYIWNMENWNLSTLQIYIKNQLLKVYSATEAQSIASRLLQDGLQIDRVQLFSRPEMPVGKDKMELIDYWINQLVRHVPLQYVLGFTWFYGCKLHVGPQVLIPRPETEELVEWVLSHKLPETVRMHDVCTGSGCIAIAIKKQRPAWSVFASDVSAEALETAEKNAVLNQTDIDFKLKDILKQDLDSKYQLVVSNPPYVTQKEKGQMAPNVLLHEPHLALFVPDADPLLFYREIATKAFVSLDSGGLLFFEINENFGKQCLDLVEKMKFVNCCLKTDLSGKDRFVKAEKP